MSTNKIKFTNMMKRNIRTNNSNRFENGETCEFKAVV